MRTQRANRYSTTSQHNQYGLFNWFAKHGIFQQDIIYETIHNFCLHNGYDKEIDLKGQKGTILFNWVANRFQKFAPYALKFLKENNYMR